MMPYRDTQNVHHYVIMTIHAVNIARRFIIFLRRDKEINRLLLPRLSRLPYAIHMLMFAKSNCNFMNYNIDLFKGKISKYMRKYDVSICPGTK